MEPPQIRDFSTSATSPKPSFVRKWATLAPMIPPPITTASALSIMQASSRPAGRSSRISSTVPSSAKHDAVTLARRRGAHLLVGHVRCDEHRVAVERASEASTAGGAVLVDVAVPRSRSRTCRAAPRAPRRPGAGRWWRLRLARPRRDRTAGGRRGRSARSEMSTGVRQRQTRSTASPPRCAPAPPESGTRP